MSAGEMEKSGTTITGTVLRRTVAPGSKSERVAVVLVDAEGRQYVLRRAGGNAFRDPALSRLVGKKITATGLMSGRSFIMDDWAMS
jgi:hypothetical protein